MTKKTKTTKSIIDQLDALCNDVLDNTHKARETLDKSDKKLFAFMERFTQEASTKYFAVVDKYCTITGRGKLAVCIQGATNHLYIKLSVGRQAGTMIVELVWASSREETLLELQYNPAWGSDEPSVYGSLPGHELYREKLAYAVQYIKSGRFEQALVEEVTKACKNRLATNATMTATAKVNNRI